MFMRLTAILMLTALTACGNTSSIGDLYSNADFGTSWNSISIPCADSSCLASMR